VSSNLADVRRRWDEERPAFERFGKIIEDALRVAVFARGIHCQVESRAKDTPSLIKKLIVKAGQHSYDSLPDRVGARCVLRYRSELETVLEVATTLFQCGEIDRKAGAMRPMEVGYQSHHVEVRLRAGDHNAAEFPPTHYWAELQVRTMAQHLWSEMSHDTFYKNEALVSAFAPGLQRRIHLMAGLIEVADVEFDRLARESNDPVVAILVALERQYYRFSNFQPDVELSLQLIPPLLATYGESSNAVALRIQAFVDAHEGTLREIYQQADRERSSPLLWQPEALMLYERLDYDEHALRSALVDILPEPELEKLALEFGYSFSA
jgi:putative GTP pyrophosphokinase